jgi:hypothetical protein
MIAYDVAQTLALLLRDLGTELDDALVQRVRELMAVEPALPSDVIDRGGPEPQAGTTSVSGGVRVGDEWTSIREQVR